VTVKVAGVPPVPVRVAVGTEVNPEPGFNTVGVAIVVAVNTTT
jgi:hypothetical protein